MEKRYRNSNPWRIFLIGVVLCVASQACVHHARLPRADEFSATQVRNLIRVPLTYQAYDYTCGVEALQSVLFYYGKEFRYDELSEVLKPDPVNGTNYRRMAEFARSLGFQVDVLTQISLEDLKKLIDSRKPVIVAFQAWPDSPVQWTESWDEGHYAVAVGYDEKNMYFMDPSTLGHYTFVPIPEFIDRWHDMDAQGKLVHFVLLITLEGALPYNPDVIERLN